MAYVRWSCDGHRSDVYAYEDCYDGFTLHVAGRRRVGLDAIPQMPTFAELAADAEAWRTRYEAHSTALAALPFESIEHDDAGKTFTFETLRELRDALARYREEGVINVPEWVVPMLDDELAACSGEEGR